MMVLLGAAALLALMAALGMFSRAEMPDLRSIGLWMLGIAGLLLAALLFFAGRGPAAIVGLVLLAPLIWSWRAEGARKPAKPVRGGMSREEAYAVLGLAAGASRAEVLAAHRRLMRAAHPDGGGSDWLAARVNQARDTLA